MGRTLLRAMVDRGARRSSAAYDTFTFNGVTYPLGMYQPQPSLGQTRDDIQDSYTDYARYAYGANAAIRTLVDRRRQVFSQGRFRFQQMRGGVPGDFFGTPALDVLDGPGRTDSGQDLMSQALQDADLAGTAVIVRERGPRLVCLRPDWVTIVAGSRRDDVGMVAPDAEVLGIVYHPGGRDRGGADPVVYLPGEFALFRYAPDPAFRFKGISWISSVVKEVQADTAATTHKLMFFENGATPATIVTLDPAVVKTVTQFEEWVNKFEERHDGLLNAYKTLYMGAGADVEVVGSDLKQLDFKVTQGAGETRLAAAAGVPPIIAGFSEGLAAATYCLPGDEPVWTLDGPRPIASVRAGDQVWATADGAMRPGVVTWQGMVGERLVYRVRTKNRILHATDNHPVLVRVPGHSRGGNASRSASVEWRAVGELRPGDEVVEPTRLPDAGGTLPSGIDPRLVQWLGAYVGDGSGVGTGAIRLAIPPTDRAREHYESLTRDIFGIHVGHEPRGFRIHSMAASGLLADMGFAGNALSKRIPGWVFRLPLDLRLRFLAGLVDTDGSIDRRGVGSLGFANRALVDQARMLALSCGVQTSNVMYRRQSPDGLPNPGIKDGYDYWSFALTTGLGAVPTADPLYQRRLAERRDHPEGHDAERAGLDGMGFFAVRSIEPMGVEPVYDIEVAGDHSFVANGIAVHNSNYGQARRAFSDITIWDLWGKMANALESVIPPPAGSKMWVDSRHIPFLQDDALDDAEIMVRKANAMRTLWDGGAEPESVIKAVEAGDLSQLQHSGNLSVQLQDPSAPKPDPTPPEPSASEGKRAIERAREQLIESGIPRPTQAQVAERLGVSDRTVRRWEGEAASALVRSASADGRSLT